MKKFVEKKIADQNAFGFFSREYLWRAKAKDMAKAISDAIDSGDQNEVLEIGYVEDYEGTVYEYGFDINMQIADLAATSSKIGEKLAQEYFWNCHWAEKKDERDTKTTFLREELHAILMAEFPGKSIKTMMHIDWDHYDLQFGFNIQ